MLRAIPCIHLSCLLKILRLVSCVGRAAGEVASWMNDLAVHAWIVLVAIHVLVVAGLVSWVRHLRLRISIGVGHGEVLGR